MEYFICKHRIMKVCSVTVAFCSELSNQPLSSEITLQT